MSMHGENQNLVGNLLMQEEILKKKGRKEGIQHSPQQTQTQTDDFLHAEKYPKRVEQLLQQHQQGTKVLKPK